MKKYFIISALGMVFLMLGCKKIEDFGSTNDNPAAISKPVLSSLLTASIYSSYAGINTRAALYAQYLSETQYTDVSLYSLPQLEFTAEYVGRLEDLQTIIEYSQVNNMTQVARIMQQYNFWTITDRWGDIPYSEALKGLEKVNPVYDTQENIYKGILSTLADAVAKLDNSSITGDILFNGDPSAWKRFGNSLRVLVALQLSKKIPEKAGYAAQEFNKALNDPGGLISNNAQNAVLNYPGGGFKNPYFNLYNGRKDFGLSKTFTDLLISLGDDRQKVFGGANQDLNAPDGLLSSNVGVPYGVKRATAEAFTAANTNWARVFRGDFRKENSPITYLSAAQISLARAEAAVLGWTSEDYKSLYANGIALSYAQWGLGSSATYLSQTSVSLGSSLNLSDDLPKILIQRYVATFPDGLQAWNLYRKTGIPALVPAPDASNSLGIPRRYTYGAGEYSSNKANVEAAVSKLNGGDKPNSKIWWDN